MTRLGVHVNSYGMTGPTENSITKLDMNEASHILEVAPATLRNWVRSGLVLPLQNKTGLYFDEASIQQTKLKISSGEINRLRKRANKNRNEKRHAHAELLRSEENGKILDALFLQYSAQPKPFLFALYLVSLKGSGLLNMDSQLSITGLSHVLMAELGDWGIDFNDPELKGIIALLLDSNLDYADDLLGYSYQSLSATGEKQKAGAYYTPQSLVVRMLERTIDTAGKFLDPCCGSGNFIVNAYLRLKSLGVGNAAEMVYGLDFDLMAVLVARANLTLVTGGKAKSQEQILHRDTLKFELKNAEFSFICTNPPWGANFSADYKVELQRIYPEISSGESFSYFLIKSLQMLRSGGRLDFVLPESILNVKMHLDIRRYLVEKYRLTEISQVPEKFSGVFTKAVSMQVESSLPQTHDLIKFEGREVSQREIGEDPDYLFSLWSDKDADLVFKEMQSRSVHYLKGHADWALGIVTGDNQRFLADTKQQGFEAIFKGTDIFRFRTGRISTYIKFDQQELQQVASEDRYRAKEKLIYRFICKELVFAVDRSGTLTLNSANVLIPRVPGYSLQVICGILNSKLGQYVYQRKFNSIKTLRGNLEKFPFPPAKPTCLKAIEELVAILEQGFDPEVYVQLNVAVLDLYQIPGHLRDAILSIELSDAFN